MTNVSKGGTTPVTRVNPFSDSQLRQGHGHSRPGSAVTPALSPLHNRHSRRCRRDWRRQRYLWARPILPGISISSRVFAHLAAGPIEPSHTLTVGRDLGEVGPAVSPRQSD